MSSTQVKQMKDRSARPLQSQNGNSEPQSTNKIQPTGEQLRIAQITSSDRSDVDPDMLKKIREVSDLTGRSNDEAWTALHDCNGDANQAVELLFEKEGEQDEWQEKKKKKKPTVTNRPQTSDTATTDTRQERADGDIDRSENIPRGQQRDRAPPRFQRGRGRGYSHNANGEKDVSASRERGSDRRFDGGRGRRGGRGGRGGEGGAGRSRGERSYGGNSAGLETVTHIDTWTNETAQNGKNDTAIGAWGDTATEEWTADEWSGSLEESLVLTRSMPTRSDIYPGTSSALDASSSQQPPQQTPQQQSLQSQAYAPSSHPNEALTDGLAAGYRSSALPPSADQNSSRSVGFDLNHLLPKFSEPYSSMTRDDESAYLSHYTKKATECIKNAVGIGSSTMAGHGVASSGLDQLGRPVSQSSNAQQVPLPSRMKQQQQQQQQMAPPHQQQLSQQQQQQQQRPRLPPPSKIPSSAVEMPGSMGNAQLDVQFGNWDAASASAATDVSGFLNDGSQASSQFAGQAVTAQQSVAMNLGGKALGGEMSLHKPSGLAMNDSASSAVLAMQEMTIGSKSTPAYQTNTAQPKDLGNSSKMTNPQQIIPFPSSGDDRKTIPFSSQQPSNQLPGQGSMGPSQLGLSQLAYSSGVESASSVYKPSSAAGGASSYSQPNISQHGTSGAVPYGSTLHYQSTGPQTIHANYPTTQGAYSAYGVAEQASFSNTPPTSYIAMSTQAPMAFSGTSKPYGSVADKPSGSFASSVLSQVYDSGTVGNAYPVVNQLGAGIQIGGYQSTGTMYPGNQGGAVLSYEAPPVVSSSVYQNQANLFRAGQMSANAANEFQSGMSESFARSSQAVASTAPQPSVPGKLMDGLNKLSSVKDSSGSVISQSYDSATAMSATTSSLTSAVTASVASSSTGGLAMSSAATASSLKASTVAAAKSTAASKTAMNWPSGGVPAPMMNINPNYMIGQPPGFQLATFGYPTTQQTLPYPYEDLQILQQRYALPAYYDLPIQASSTLPTRDLQASLTTASYIPGSDVKLAAPMEPQVSVAAVQPPQQGPTAGAGQQSYQAAAAAMHPGYSYYYPPAAGMVPYYAPMIPVGGVAVPMVTNPTHGATTSSAQYQKPTLYGSHTFGAGGQSQDFSKTFMPQASVKATGTTTGMTPNDMIAAAAAGNAFGKSHVQGFDKVGFHSGTPPPTSFSLALASGTQGGALGQPAIYGAPYMPMMQHQQQSHSQIMHQALAAQDSSMAGRSGVQPNAVQAKVGSNKTYNPYWAGSN